MAKRLTPVDVTNIPGLLQLVAEVRESGKPRLLRRDNEDLAVLSPVVRSSKRSPRKAKTYTKADDDAFLSSAGSWKDFNLEEFLRNNEESRRSSRPLAEL